MLRELGLVEQRYKAVLEVLDGAASVTDVARRYGVGRQTVHRWLRRYAAEGMAGLADRSSRPGSCPHQMPAAFEARVVEMRRQHPGWGPRTILNRLNRADAAPLPSRSAIYRALVRHQLIVPKRRRRRPNDYKRWERSRPMELWQMDVTFGVQMRDGSRPAVVTGIDDHSRFCVSAKVVERATARPVCDALLEAMRRHGVPEAILSDNGKVFTGRFGPRKGEVLFDRICREHGIRHLLTAPASPTTTGKVERFHKTMKQELLHEHVFSSIAEAQEALDTWVQRYNHTREHQSLGNRPPAERFSAATPRHLDDEPEMKTVSQDAKLRTPTPRLLRRVLVDGKVSLLGFKYHVGRYLAGQSVELITRDGLVEIFHDSVLVATHARRHQREQEQRVQQQALAAAPSRPASDRVVVRKVDHNGTVSFAGTSYRVGNAYRGQQVEVCLVGDTVQIWGEDRILRTHAARHDRRKEHGAFANPGGRAERINAS
ncbi:MAG TPA: IS481 family transposase [Myxococcota bacterium]